MIGARTSKNQNSNTLQPGARLYGGGATVSHGGPLGPQSSMMKPMNKITLESFSQIAKLSGDVDHEPSTPKSGNARQKNLSSEDEDID